MKYYLAGGAVRDLLLGRIPRDADYVFDVPEQAFIQRNPEARKIKSEPRPIYLLNGQDFSPLPFAASTAAAISLDIAARDFSINALLLAPDGVIHAHARSFADLRAGLIRPTSPAALAADPLRAYRAARFAAALPGFRLHPECLEHMRALSGRERDGIAAERVGAETLKACAGERPGDFLRALEQGGCLCPWFAEFAEAAHIPAGPPAWHDSSVLEHTATVMDAVAKACDHAPAPLTAGRSRPLAVWMALCHDLGKTGTPADLLPHHYGHEIRGEAYARALGLRLRLPAVFIRAGALASRLHMKAGIYSRLRPGTRVDLLLALHASHLLEPFALMAAADSGRPDLPERLRRELALILPATLPQEWRDKGAASGQRLRELRCACLAGAAD